jgi:sulfofructose kinase
MKRIVCVGHAALDHIFRIEAFPVRATKVRAIEYVESGGGMAANAAAAIARLGGSVELWSRVGDDDTGVKIRRGLKAAGVDARYVQSFEEGRSSTSAILVDDQGERLIVGARDVNMPSGTSWLPLERVRDSAAVLADLRWLEGARMVFETARAAGVTTVLDAELGGREALSDLLRLTDYAIFSEPALDEFAGKGKREDLLERVSKLGPRHVGVTLGSAGYVWLEDGGFHACPAFAVDAVDTTGAGDVFHGAFTLALVEGRASSDCARTACAAAALKCMRLGARAGLPTRKELATFLLANPSRGEAQR